MFTYLIQNIYVQNTFKALKHSKVLVIHHKCESESVKIVLRLGLR